MEWGIPISQIGLYICDVAGSPIVRSRIGGSYVKNDTYEIQISYFQRYSVGPGAKNRFGEAFPHNRASAKPHDRRKQRSQKRSRYKRNARPKRSSNAQGAQRSSIISTSAKLGNAREQANPFRNTPCTIRVFLPDGVYKLCLKKVTFRHR